MKKTIAVIAPVYNEEKVIAAFCKEIHTVFDVLSEQYNCELFLVLDRSEDDTFKIASDIALKNSNTKVILMSSRFGHQVAILAGLDCAKADMYIMMDSDLQHPPELIHELVKEHNLGHDIVYTIRSNTENISYLRKVLGDIFYWFILKISDAPLVKNAADFRLISNKVADVFRDNIRERNLFIRGLISWMGFSQKAIPYVAHERFAGKTKFSFSRNLKFAMNAVVSFSDFPLKLSLSLGVLFSLSGFLFGVFTIVLYFINRNAPSGWYTLIILIVMFSGVQLLAMGMLGMYIGAIYKEVKHRPLYIIDKKINLES